MTAQEAALLRDAILEKLKSGDMELEDARKQMARIAAETAHRPTTLTVDRNKSGGLYIRHPKVMGYSSKKNKDYVATVNFPEGVAESLFGDDTVLSEITEAVRQFTKNGNGHANAKREKREKVVQAL